MKVTRGPVRTRPGDRFQTPRLRADLRLRLLEAILWSAPRADLNNPGTCLRSEALRPYLFNDSRHETVYDVVWERHRALVKSGEIEDFSTLDKNEETAETQQLLPPSLAGGRLLVWERDETIDDGVGQICTRGYLDYTDMPPWDTWVTYVSKVTTPPGAAYLISWVPQSFVSLVDEAVYSNAYKALYWLAGTGLLVARILGDEGYLA